MSRSKYSAEFIAKISQKCIEEIGTIGFLANKYGIGYSTLKGGIKEHKRAFCHKKVGLF